MERPDNAARWPCRIGVHGIGHDIQQEAAVRHRLHIDSAARPLDVGPPPLLVVIAPLLTPTTTAQPEGDRRSRLSRIVEKLLEANPPTFFKDVPSGMLG